MKPFGRLVTMGQSAGAEATFNSATVRGKPVSILGYTNYTAGEERKADAYAQLARHAAAGEIRVGLEHIGLGDVPGAWRREGSSHRKVIVVVALSAPARPGATAAPFTPRSSGAPGPGTTRTRAGTAARGRRPIAAR